MPVFRIIPLALLLILLAACGPAATEDASQVRARHQREQN